MTSRTARARWCARALPALLLPRIALAESNDSAAAQGLYDEARALMEAGRSAEACPKLEESQRLDPGSGTLTNLAKCYEDTGRIASAWSTYLEAATAAHAVGNVEREAYARARAAELGPRVPRLVVQVPAAARVPGLEVLRDDTKIGSAQWGVPVPADPGAHRIAARAPDHAAWNGAVNVAETGSTEIVVPKLVAAPRPSPPPAGSAVEGPLGTQRIAAIAVGGVGVVGLAVGSLFGLKAISKKNDADRYCNGSDCTDARGVASGNDAHGAGNVATIGMVVGAVGIAGGAALWLTAPSRTRTPEIGLGARGVEVRGVF